MRWEDEQWVKLYTRDTVTWKLLSWQSRCTLAMLLRKIDRAGLMDLGGAGYEGVAALLEMPFDVVEPGMAGLVMKGVVLVTPEFLLLPNFKAAQEAASSDKARQKKARETARDDANAKAKIISKQTKTVTNCDGIVTKRDETVTRRHAASRIEESSLEKSREEKSRVLIPDSVESEPPKKRRARTETNPRHAPMLGLLESEFERAKGVKYGFDRRDAPAITALLAKGSDEEILARWRRGLGGRGFLCVEDIYNLNAKWNSLNGAVQMQLDPRKGYTDAQDQDWSGDGGYGAANKKAAP